MESVPPALSKKILIFFCLGLDIRVPKLVEAENEGILVEVENGT